MKRKLNIKLLGVLILIVVLGGASAFAVRRFQQGRRAEEILEAAGRSERAGDLEGATSELARYLVYRPEDSEVLARQAILLDRLATEAPDPRRVQDAHRALQRASSRLPDREDLRRLAVDRAMDPAVADFNAAASDIEQLLAASPRDGMLLEKLGRCLEGRGKDGDVEAAAARYEEAIAADPSLVNAHERLANLLRTRLNDPARADRVMDAVEEEDGLIAKNPESAEALLARARYRRTHGIDGADADVERAQVLDPEDFKVQMAVVAAAVARGDFKTARLEASKVVDAHPEEERAYLVLAAAEQADGDFEAAAEALTKGVEAVPDSALLQWSLAESLINAGQTEQAEAAIAGLRSRKDILAAAVDLLEAFSLARRGDLTKASEVLDRAAPLLAASKATDLGVRAELLQAELSGKLDRPDKQLTASRRALGLLPDSAEARLLEAQALASLGKDDQALASYRAIAPRVPAARLEVARRVLLANLEAPAQSRRWEEFDKALSTLEGLDGFEVPVDLLRAEALLAREGLDRARERLERSRADHPDRVEPRIALAELVATGPGGLDASMTILDEAARDLGNLPEIRLAQIRIAALRPPEEALSAVESLKRDLDAFDDPDRSRIELALAEVFARFGDTEGAARLAHEAAGHDPIALGPQTTLLLLALESGDREGVRDAGESLRKIEGENGPLWRYAEAGGLLLKARAGEPADLGRADRLAAEAAERKPGWAPLYLLRAELASRADAPEQAAEAYLKAAEAGDRQPEVVQAAAALLARRGRDAEASKLIQESRAASDDPRPTLTRMAAELALRRGESDQAATLAIEAVPSTSEDPEALLWLGSLLNAAGKPGEAEAPLRNALAKAPERPEAHLALVRALVAAQKPDAAKAAVEAIAAQVPADRLPSTLAAGYELTGQVEEAEAQYRAALKDRPRDRELLEAASSFALRTARAEWAEELMRTLLVADTEAPPAVQAEARRNLALVLVNREEASDFNEAIGLLDQNLKDPGGGSVDDRRIRALLLATRPGHQREAIESLERLAQEGTPTPPELFLRARLHAQRREWNKARDLYLKALAAEPDNPAYLAGYARYLLSSNQAGQADGWIAKLEKAAPKSFEAVELRSRLHVARGNPDRAADLLTTYAHDEGSEAIVAATLERLDLFKPAEAILRESAEGSDRPEAALALAGFLGRRGRVDEALSTCEVAWKTCPPTAVATACIVVLQAGPADKSDFERAASQIEAAIADHPEDPSILFALANLEGLRGDYDKAEALFRRIDALAPGNSGPPNNLAWLLAARGRRLDEALALVDRAIAIDGEVPDLLDTRALVRIARGETDRALADATELVAQLPAPTAYFRLAAAQLAAGDRTAAAETFKQRCGELSRGSLHPLERPSYDRLSMLATE